MSHGPGKLQRTLWHLLSNSSKPVTFAELRDGKLSPTFERSCRRSLKQMVADGVVIALGTGGPGDPKRYCINPMVAAMAGDEKGFRAAVARLESRPNN